ncbi:MAG TPA: EAL domain-containing protein, partial [Gammaproteobacteria bacterium]|nr:EAL domain-containing protein [Gammaproteobacteria bacterium]
MKARTLDLDNTLSLSTATLESTHEGILVTNKTGEIVLYNNVFLSLWDLPIDLFNQKHLNALLVKLSELVVESELFSQMMMDLSTNPKTGVIREWDLKNNKIIELYTHPQLLHEEIIGCVFSFLDITERKNLERQVQYQTTHDDLTGLPNRSLNIDRIQQALAYAKRNHSFVAILMFDLDNFKSINDSLNTDIGDEMLKMVANRLTSTLRETDSISRLGGDEFVMILTTLNQESDLLARINQIFSLFQTPWEINSDKLVMTASLGISVFPRDGEDAQTLLKNADIALHHAKEMGRNTMQFYQPQFAEKLFHQVDIVSALHKALANNEFVLEYQPVVDLKTNQIIGVEALIRWQHPSLGMLQPDSFIPLAEKSGLIYDIGKWILKKACEQNLEWQKEVNPKFTMAVNISGYQFRKEDFFNDVVQIIKETAIDPHYLVFEITESAILGNPTEISNKMRKLKEIGINFAIDDFGTGYSTFNYLKYYPFDCIKIDKSFIQGIFTSMEDKTIVETIISMSSTLAVTVLAEGAETIEQI